MAHGQTRPYADTFGLESAEPWAQTRPCKDGGRDDVEGATGPTDALLSFDGRNMTDRKAIGHGVRWVPERLRLVGGVRAVSVRLATDLPRTRPGFATGLPRILSSRAYLLPRTCHGLAVLLLA